MAIADGCYKEFVLLAPAPHKGKRCATMASPQPLGIAGNMKMWREIGVTDPPARWGACMAALANLKAEGYEPITCSARDRPTNAPLNHAPCSKLDACRGEQADIGAESWTRRKRDLHHQDG